ncbi:MAG TPA: DedA family protein [Chloroflexia bacterium]|nr:DedA family protein [Chloroflexia bacterium]
MLKGLENSLIDFLKTFYQSVGWLGVLLMMAIESMMIPLPSEIIMPLAGWLLIHNTAGDAPLWLQLVWAGVVGGAGCLLGSVIAYWIGRLGGRPLVIKYGKYVLINTHHLDVSERWMMRWGALASFVSRLLPVVRTFCSLPLGVAEAPFVAFCVLTFAGSFIWSIALAGIGFALGSQFEEVRNSISWLDYPIIAIILLLIGWFIYSNLKKRKRGVQGQNLHPAENEINLNK